MALVIVYLIILGLIERNLMKCISFCYTGSTFAFGSANNQSEVAKPSFDFGAKPAFGNQTETKPPSFSFSTISSAPSTAPVFGSTAAAAAAVPITATTTASPPQFGATSGIGNILFNNANVEIK